MRSYVQILKPENDMIRFMFWKTSLQVRRMNWRGTGMEAERLISRLGD